MLKVAIANLINNSTSDVDTTPGEKRALVVATRDLKTFDPITKHFSNTTYGFDMNVNGAIGGTEEQVYTDGAGGTTWPWTAISGVWNFASTTEVHSGTSSIDATATNNGNTAQALKTGGPFSLTGLNSLHGYIYVTSWPTTGVKEVLVYGWNTATGTIIGTAVNIGNYINTQQFNVWQSFTIPLAQMGLTGQSIYALRVQTVETGTGVAPNYYLDDISFFQGVSIEFQIAPDAETWLHVCSINFAFADAYEGIVTVAGSTENATLPALSYDKLLGVNQLANGIVFQIVKNGTTYSNASFRNLFDYVILPPTQVIGYAGDGTNAWLQVRWTPPAPIILKAEEEDYISLIVQDDLTGLLEFRSAGCCLVEYR